MANLVLFVETFIFSFLFACGESPANTYLQEVYVSTFGRDFVNCGSQDEPCRSMKLAVLRVTWDGMILLNGTGTKKYPFDCGDSDTAFNINKSVTIEGTYFKPRVSCYCGINFQVYPSKGQSSGIKLSGIIFDGTPLTFSDSLNVNIINCLFENAPTALTVQVQDNKAFELEIQYSKFLYNEVFCIKLSLLSTGTNGTSLVSMKVTDTHFMGNGLQKRTLSESGVIKVTTEAEVEVTSARIIASFQNITCSKNYGYFMNLNASSAVTEETYKDVRLLDNTQSLSQKVASKFGADSLYYSVTRETRIRFINLHCIQNFNFRCIAIQAKKADVEIRNSKLVGQYGKPSLKKGAGLFLVANITALLNVSNTNFTSNGAILGGCVFANAPNGTFMAKFTDVEFKHCEASKTGCALAAGEPPLQRQHYASCPSKMHLTISNANIVGCHRKTVQKCIIVYLCLKSGVIKITESQWRNNLQKSGSSLHIAREIGHGKTAITVSRSSFTDNEGSSISMAAPNSIGGNVTIVDTLITNNATKPGTALSISPKYLLKLVNVSVVHAHYGLKMIIRPDPRQELFPVDISIYNCSFKNNIYDMLFSLRDPSSVRLMIQNTVFTSKESWNRSYAIRFHIPPLAKLNISKAVIGLDNNTFDNRPSTNFALFFHGSKTLWIKRSTFRNCVCLYREKWTMPPSSASANYYFYETATGALSIITTPDTPLKSGCVQRNTTNDTHPLWTYGCDVVIENTIFQDNTGIIAGAVSINNGNTTFQNCVFRDNFGIEQAGHVYSAYGTGQVLFKDCFFVRTKESLELRNRTFSKAILLYSESGGPMKLENTSMTSFVSTWSPYPVLYISSGGYFSMDNNTSIQCNRGSQLWLENTTHYSSSENFKNFCKLNVTCLKFTCWTCAPDHYSLEGGRSRGLAVVKMKCFKCPFGATCKTGIITADDNFWGYQSTESLRELQFIPCPSSYCQSPATGSTEYNECVGNRTSILCGSCAPGFGETLLSTDCLANEKCSNSMFWFLKILATASLATYLLTKPPIFNFLKNQIFWFRKQEHGMVREDLGDVGEQLDSGYLKIIFYFYQAAEVLTVGSTDGLLHKISFISVIVAGFNFRFRIFKEIAGCPFVGLTAVTKELMQSGTVFATMTEVFIIYWLHVSFNILRRKAVPSPQRYMATIIEILLLGYERLAETSLKLLRCVPIGSEKRLYLDGTVTCWQWWQYALLAYVIVFVMPFFFVLYLGSFQLHRGVVSTGEFLGACIMPLPFLIYWFIRIKMRANTEASLVRGKTVNEPVLEVLQGPFRPPNDEDDGTLYWESVLIGRRLILLACRAFVDDEMLCLVLMATLCVFILLHHLFKNPYHNTVTNNTETVSLFALVIISLINIPKATLISFSTSRHGPSKRYLKAMEWIEISVLVFFPLWLSLCVALAIISQLCRLIAPTAIRLYRYIRRSHAMTWNTIAIRSPLLDPDSDS
ncbi:uncharacterized protein LOC111333252 [Stylophora pistillata]|uniref:uncharacterized protein LOC111333252 n=1 Tax=Stylophora pistillata TaxID=50429 RepID=UPI000C03BA1A|nr:uncharacterized protein LOC111333252 [Stylophora pistillata]